jgi:GH15 family glucan-1,4-alpha-glucosidase
MLPIEDYALIGDCRSAALIGRDGSLDWLCFPRFDSPSVFCRILDDHRGGAFEVTLREGSPVGRQYVSDTNVLVTEFESPEGRIELIDAMPLREAATHAEELTRHTLVRGVRCTQGRAVVDLWCWPRFEYGRFTPRFQQISPVTVDIVGGADALLCTATHPIDAFPEALGGTWTLEEGETAWIRLSYRRSYEDTPEVAPGSTGVEVPAVVDATIDWWREWAARCTYDGPYRSMVRRSALTLKAMTYQPSGALIAAPTTSLPESMGGVRNWDYRYTWVRDSTLTLTSLAVLGYTEEAEAFKTFLARAGAGRPQDLQIMFGIGGERGLPEIELDHLDGYKGSRPVRIGNGAATQLQLDSYGQVLDAAYLLARVGGELDADNWKFLSGLTDIVCRRWREPDHGIWEMRDEPRHFTHSKLNCWVALDRAIKLAEARGLEAPLEEWRKERELVSEFLMREAAAAGWFQQAAGVQSPDASSLLIPSLGFLPATHPLVLETIRQVRKHLERDGLVYRYLSSDGLAGDEGAFLLCSFWLVDCLIWSGELDQAEQLLEQLMGCANDVGLFAEEIDPDTGVALGNFPQAFSHMALVQSCANLAAARSGFRSDGAVPFPELAIASQGR